MDTSTRALILRSVVYICVTLILDEHYLLV